MNEKIGADELRAALDRRLSGLQADPRLGQRIMAAGEIAAPGRRRLAAPLAMAIVLMCVVATGALAAALQALGIVDFAAMQGDTFIPPRYADCIVHEGLTVDAGRVTCTIQESYYDGKVLRLTAHIVPKEEVLLIGGDASPLDPAAGYFPAPEGMSIAAYALAHHGGCLADVSIHAGKNDTHSFLPHADGSATLYTECVFDDELPVRELELRLVYMPVWISADASCAYDSSAREVTSIPMVFSAVAVQTYTCTEPLPFPGVGVRVTQVALTVTPLEIRYTLNYEITDLNAFAAQQGALWFEFITPANAGAACPAQRVSAGLSSSDSAGRADGAHTLPDEVGTVYRQTGTIGLDALGGQYTLRACNAMDKTRYEAITFSVSER